MKNSSVAKTNALVLMIAVFLVSGCEEKAKPFKGEIYRSVDDKKVIRIYSPDELEVKEGSSPNLVAKYTTEEGGNKLRVVITAMGTTQAVYYTITKDGIIDEDGTTLYSTANFEAAREKHYCSVVQSDMEKLAKAQEEYLKKEKKYLVSAEKRFPRRFDFRASKGVNIDLTGVPGGPGKYFIAMATHEWCSKAYWWASESGGLQAPIAVGDAAGKLEEVRAKARQDVKIAQKKAEEEGRKKEEAARVAREKAEAEARRKAEEKRKRLTAEAAKLLVPIKGGCFDMGDNFGDGQRDEKPVHRVCLDNFRMDKYEVTQAAFKKVMGKNPSKHRNCPDCPVERVTWFEAKKYCEYVGKRLPTEAQWEYAAREGGKKVKYGTGKNEINCNTTNYGGWCGDMKPVGSYAPNALGLYDMAGNVVEWTADWYDGGYYRNSPEKNPNGPDKGSVRVLRGRSWNSNSEYLRAANRSNYRPVKRSNSNRFGFRCSQ